MPSKNKIIVPLFKGSFLYDFMLYKQLIVLPVFLIKTRTTSLVAIQLLYNDCVSYLKRYLTNKIIRRTKGIWDITYHLFKLSSCYLMPAFRIWVIRFLITTPRAANVVLINRSNSHVKRGRAPNGHREDICRVVFNAQNY